MFTRSADRLPDLETAMQTHLQAARQLTYEQWGQLHYWDFPYSKTDRARLFANRFLPHLEMIDPIWWLVLSPTQNPTKFIAPLMNYPHSEMTVSLTLLLEVFPLGGQKFAGIADGISLIWKQQRKLLKLLHIQPTIPKVEISIPKRHDHPNSKNQW